MTFLFVVARLDSISNARAAESLQAITSTAAGTSSSRNGLFSFSDQPTPYPIGSVSHRRGSTRPTFYLERLQ